MNSNSGKKRKQPLTERAYEKIRSGIIKVDFAPGQGLSVKELSLKFKIGRTPIREALIKLESEGLVEIHPRRSIFVSNITLQGVKAFFEAYFIIEKHITRLAAERITKEEVDRLWKIDEQIHQSFLQKDFYQMSIANSELHTIIAEASQNQYLMNISKFLYLNSQRLSYISYSGNNRGFDEQGLSEILSQHQKMIQYIDEKDLSNLEDLVAMHTKTFQTRIIHYLISQGPPREEVPRTLHAKSMDSRTRWAGEIV